MPNTKDSFLRILDKATDMSLNPGLTLLASAIGNKRRMEVKLDHGGLTSGQEIARESFLAREIREKLTPGNCAVVETEHGPIVVFHNPGQTDSHGTLPSFLLFLRPIQL